MKLLDKAKEVLEQKKLEREAHNQEKAAIKEEEKNQRELERQAEMKTYSAERVKLAEKKGKERAAQPQGVKEKVKAFVQKQVTAKPQGKRTLRAPPQAHQGFSFPTHSPMNFGGPTNKRLVPPNFSPFGFGGGKRKPQKFKW
jgi:hypothetical protein